MRRRHAPHRPATVMIAGDTVAAGAATAIDLIACEGERRIFNIAFACGLNDLCYFNSSFRGRAPTVARGAGGNPWDDMTQHALAVRVAICRSCKTAPSNPRRTPRSDRAFGAAFGAAATRGKVID